MERVTRQVFVMSFLLATCTEKGWKLVGRSRDHQTGGKSRQKFLLQDFSRSGRRKDECRARSDDYIIHRAIGSKTFPCEPHWSNKENGGTRKGGRKERGSEREENRYIEQRTRWLMIRISAPTTCASSIFYRHFYFPTYSRFSRKRSPAASSISYLSSRERERIAFCGCRAETYHVLWTYSQKYEIN